LGLPSEFAKPRNTNPQKGACNWGGNTYSIWGVLGWGKLLKEGYLRHLRKRWRGVSNMDVTETGFEDGRKMAHDRAQLCPLWCQRLWTSAVYC